MANKIRVLIVDDSSFMRDSIKSILESDPEIEVIACAEDGRKGAELALALKPDVVTMDIKMPVMNGLEAIEQIMQTNPLPIIVVSTIDKNIVVGALNLGAMDFVSISQDIELIAKELIEKIKISSRVKALKRMKKSSSVAQKTVLQSCISKVVVVGVSTGGPQALNVFLSKIPADIQAGILIVQHMSKGFIDGLAEWLKQNSKIDIRVAKQGDVLVNGTALLAPDDCNMGINSEGSILFSRDTKNQFYVPSIDYTMLSAAEVFKTKVIGVIMTGMAKDGVEGIKKIKANGGVTLAQDEATSVIYGMNKTAIETGAVDKVVPLEKIAYELTNILEECYG